MSWPAVLLWIVILAAGVSRGPAMIYVLSGTLVFGSLQMLPTGSSGINLLPQSICAAVLVAKVLLQKGNVVRGTEAALDPRRIGPFTAFLVFSLMSAVVLPRLFAGAFEVIPVSYVSGASLLASSTSNITQSAYMTISFATALCFSILGSQVTVQRHFIMAQLLTAIALLSTGLADFATYQTHTSSLLEPFRNASYTLLSDVEAAGAKRVVGFTPEASVFGAYCVQLLATLLFLRPLFQGAFRTIVVPLTIVALLVMTLMSTSSTAYVGLAVTTMVYAGNMVLRFRSSEAVSRDGLRWEAGILAVSGFALFVIVIAMPHVLDPVTDLVNTMVFQKTSSASYLERNGWNQVGIQVIGNSGGLGVGLGSIRTSNWFISILASTGLFGALLIFSFIARLLLGGRPAGRGIDDNLRWALRLSLLPLFVMIGIGGTIPDIGIIAATSFGLLSAQG